MNEYSKQHERTLTYAKHIPVPLENLPINEDGMIAGDNHTRMLCAYQVVLKGIQQENLHQDTNFESRLRLWE